MRTFPIGGIHPHDNKEWSKDRAIERLELPDQVYIPMIQHIGAPSTPLVKKGDKVVTIGGITGVVVDVKENKFVLETGADQVRIEFEKWALSTNETAAEAKKNEAKKAQENKAKAKAAKKAEKNQ